MVVENISKKSKQVPKNKKTKKQKKKKIIDIIPLDHPTTSDCDQILNLTGLLHSHYIFQVQKFLL